MAQAEDWLERQFPRLAASKAYTVTSQPTTDYNCIAWTAGVNDEWWWPEEDGYWPSGLPRENTVANFVEAFRLLGYEQCEGFELESGFQKIAIYVGDDGAPTHMARQLDDGTWTSKCGAGWDISHTTLYELEGNPGYGRVTLPLKRPVVPTEVMN